MKYIIIVVLAVLMFSCEGKKETKNNSQDGGFLPEDHEGVPEMALCFPDRDGWSWIPFILSV